MPITKIASSSLEENQENYINILRAGQSVSDTGWTTYSNSGSINPTNGTTGTTSITWSQNTSNPLSGDADLRLVKDANNRQGDGVSIPFTIANRHLAKVLQISFDMELISGTYLNPILTPVSGLANASASTTCTITANNSLQNGQSVFVTFASNPPVNNYYTVSSVTSTSFVITLASTATLSNAACSYTAIGDLRVSIIQDPTGTPVLLEPVNTNIQLGIANQRIKHIATFQTHVSIASYRLCIHVANQGTNAFTVDFNNFRVWETTQSIGSIVTDWVSYMPTINGITSSSSSFQWRRVGGSVEIFGSLTFSSSTSATFQLPLPSGLSINSSVIRKTLFGNMRVARATADANNPSWFLIGIGDTSYLTLSPQSVNYNSRLTDFNSSSTGAVSGDIITLQASVPIAGWGSSVAMSSDSGDGRVVSAIYKNLVGSLNTQYGFQWNTRVIDTHNAVSQTGSSPNARTVFTAPINGFYQVSAFVLCNNSGYVDIYKNDSIYARISGIENTSYGESISFTISLNAGENFYIRTMNMTSTSTSTSDGQFSVFRISAGSQVIATQETVAASAYIGGGNQTTTGGTIINFNTKWFDTHNAITTGTNWRFTAPMSGKYRFSGELMLSNASQRTQLFKNGSSWVFGVTRQPVGSNQGGNFSITLDLIGGDFIDLRSTSSTDYFGGNPLATSEPCYISIERIGI